MLCLLSIYDFDASIVDQGFRSFASVHAVLSDEASLWIQIVELCAKTGCSLLSHIMPVTKDVTCEWMVHVICSNPIHNFGFELNVSHINVLVEGFLTVEPLDVMPDIWFRSMRD